LENGFGEKRKEVSGEREGKKLLVKRFVVGRSKRERGRSRGKSWEGEQRLWGEERAKALL